MKMFKDVVGRIEPNFYDKYVCLEKCCDFFGLKASNNSYHNALFDAFMTARMVCKLYEIIENDPRFRKFKREIRFNPNCYKNYNTIASYKNNIQNNKKLLGQKTEHDKKEVIKYEQEANEIQIQRNKNLNENINNSPESTMSTGNLDESVEKKDENVNTGENENLSDDIIDEIFNDL